jgi:hypothetical protein
MLVGIQIVVFWIVGYQHLPPSSGRSLIPKMFFKTLVSGYKITWCHNPEDHNLNFSILLVCMHALLAFGRSLDQTSELIFMTSFFCRNVQTV